ncbi:hypothetical protein OAP18_02495 [Gammaproteobacteria bacterium]|nr:hypothetical protein [Gammaproteobacteria bacterium]
MKRALVVGLCTAPLLFASLAQAQEEQGFTLGVKAGTTGTGVELGYSFSETLSLRGSYNYFESDVDVDDTDIEYKAEFNKSSLALMLDWHPWENSFRFSAGAYSHSDNNINLNARSTIAGTFEFNNTTYDATNIGSVRGDVDFTKTTPYLGVGWGLNAFSDKKFALTLEFGVQFQGSPDVSLVANNCTLPGILCDQLNADIQVELAELDDDLEDFDIWPVANIGFAMKF